MNPERMTLKTIDALQNAQQLAAGAGHAEWTSLHLLAALTSQSEGIVTPILQRLGVDPAGIQNAVQQELATFPTVAGGAEPQTSRQLAETLKQADGLRQEFGDEYLSTEHLLLAMTRGNDRAGETLKRFGATEKGVLSALRDVRGDRRVTDSSPEDKLQALRKYARDLTELAREGKLDPVIGRDDEIRRTMQVLSRRTKNNPVLIGEPGVGKTAIAEGLARRIADGDVPESLKDRSLLALDLGALVAGAKFRGEFEDRLKSVLKEIQDSDGNNLLFIDELHTLVGAGAAEGAMDAANLLKPALARGELRCIGATTLAEYRKYIEKDSALERRFQPVKVGEPSVPDTISILRGLKERYEVHHGVRIQDAALVAAATLSDRYIRDRFLPDKAIDLIDEAAALLKMQIDSVPTEIDELQRKTLQLEVEKQALSQESDRASRDRLAAIESELADLNEQLIAMKQRWDNEKSAIHEVQEINKRIEKTREETEKAERASALERAAELRYGEIPELESRRTELNACLEELQKDGAMLSEEVTDENIATVVAEWSGIPTAKLLEGEVEKLIHLEDHLHCRVIGQNEAVTAAATAVRRARAGLKDPARPVGTFLFLGPTGVGKTELAKALAESLFGDERALVRLDMSEYSERHSVARMIGSPPGYVGHDEGGQLTEAVRRRPYSVILFDEIEKAHSEIFNVLLQVLDDGRLTDGKGRTVDFRNTILILSSNVQPDALQHTFRPEFLNRLDSTIEFESLGRDALSQIVDLQISRFAGILSERGLSLEVSDAARGRLAEWGYDPAFGARPLKRAIQKWLLDPLSLDLLEGKFLAGDTVRVDVATDGESLALSTGELTRT
ncbi:MAG: ATP-dependent chaperone ClpB [Acidobacteriota bacterium]|nr:ATP-dependent chaperone ClpB [Acidobacteriota bacterium]